MPFTSIVTLHPTLDLGDSVWDGAQVNGTQFCCAVSKLSTVLNLRQVKTVSTGKVRSDRDTLKGARVRLGLDQGQLAKAAGLTQQTVSNFETSKTVPHESTREAIQHALELRGIVFTNGDLPGFYFDKSKIVIPT